MSRTVFHLATIIGLSLATSAEARLMYAHLPAPDEAALAAVHLPTGCLAEIVVSGRNLVSAQITDPLCLPHGVQAREVPGRMVDFTVTPE